MDENDFLVLHRILKEIEILQQATADVTFEKFYTDEVLKRAVAMAFLNIGEFANRLSANLRASAKDIPFKEIIATRNNAAHGYDGLRFDFIWKTIHEDIPILKEQILSLFEIT